tara:strand:+ start:130 stop:321 length:192 start_codon:yes stop_codon:yes gene_type:complete
LPFSFKKISTVIKLITSAEKFKTKANFRERLRKKERIKTKHIIAVTIMKTNVRKLNSVAPLLR